MKEKVSVIIPVYNVEEYLDRCVESVINQTYTELEIILVDDGSTDSSGKLCDRWAERDVRIKAVHKENEGLGMARNTGLENATGKYVFFIDSDDFVHLFLVERCVCLAEELNADAVIFGRCDVYEDGSEKKLEIKSNKDVYFSEDIKKELLPAMFTYSLGFGVSSCCRMHRLDSINSAGCRFMSEREMISEDAFFSLQFLSKAKRVAILSENYYFYCKRTTSLSHSFRADRQAKNDVFLKTLVDFAKKEGLPSSLGVYISARYHMYTVAALKQIAASSLSKKEKRARLYEIFNNTLLLSSLKKDVLREHNKNMRLFFTLLKYRLYPICILLLKYKVKKD